MASKAEAAKAKAIADTLRQQVFIGVEATEAQESAAKASAGGQQPRRERLLNVLSVMERDSSKGSRSAKPRILCITVKRNKKLRLHKVKMNGKTAAISKTWGMDDVKGIEFKEPTRFSLNLNHKYDFTSADAALVEGFVQMLVSFCNKYSVKPPRYINTVSGATGATPSGGIGTIRPKTVYRSQQNTGANSGGMPLTTFENGAPGKQHAAGPSGDVVGSRTVSRPSEQSAVMRRMTKYVANHGGDVSALVPLGAQQPEIPAEDDVDAGGLEDEADDADELLLDEAFMLSADELVGDFGWRANIDAAQLESRLLAELHKLESENVRDMLEADQHVPKVVKELDQAIAHLEEMDQMLKFYCLELESMDDDVRKIQLENENLKIEEANQKRLLIELEKILKSITLSEEELQALRNESLETTDGIERVERVAASLKRMLGTTPGGHVGGFEATQEKMKKYEFYCANFSTRVHDYLKVMFQFKINGSEKERGRLTKRGIHLISGPETVHKELIKYAGLTLWLKESKPSADKELQALYIQCMNMLYSNQTKELVESCRPFFYRYRHDVSSGGVSPIAEFSFSTNVASAAGGAPATQSRRISLDGISGAAHHAIASAVKGDPSSGAAATVVPSSEMQPAEAFAIALQNVVSNVIVEQNFISDLFHYVPPAHIRAARRAHADKQPSKGNGEAGDRITFYNWVTQRLHPIERWEKPRAKLDSKSVVSSTIHFGSVKEVKSMQDLLFGKLVTLVDSMVDMGTRFDPSQSIGMLVAVSKALDLCKNSDQGFLLNILERCNEKLENIFQTYITEQARVIEATKLVTKKRIGALPFARIFPKFIAHIESLVGNSGYGARAIADSAYSRISRLIFDTLESLLREAERNAQQHLDDKDAQKEQLNTHVLLIENMFVLISGLQAYRSKGCSSYFTPTLDTYLDHAQIVQRKVMRGYIKDVLKRPMGKLIDFFDAVDKCLATNKNPATMANLNKSHLKKVTQAHSNSTMRENLKQLYKRVEKHFINEPRLRQVIWKEIGDDILSNYQRFVTLLARAYQGTNMSLDFTQTDLKRWLDDH
ncbi:hypothetical protein GGI12_004484 [Dipsacomyces acuminosporus]|nr:hypothetical protein GGI12_004484 [Dipsacomyces acuminosporus]